ncbi:MAG: hypothetical protein AVDCRST_MAG93-8734 [uncultured Chloroflexia bacterium]|uniref:Uncharacterized protein n=1 Tax=uncultured Chloroflexia bacterium TaxID=1672391 RepID=A0A6J4N5J8_9CHLR|nr:MAG: hypothetical protein AVDCRST_MAG93-8734 [uncultured Chloroflexia bacterium]
MASDLLAEIFSWFVLDWPSRQKRTQQPPAALPQRKTRREARRARRQAKQNKDN